MEPKCKGRAGKCDKLARPGRKMCAECAADRVRVAMKSYRKNKAKVLAKSKQRVRKARDYDKLAASLEAARRENERLRGVIAELEKRPAQNSESAFPHTRTGEKK